MLGALGVAVGDGRCYRCAERVCVERQRLQRLQQPERLRRLVRLVRRLRRRRRLGYGQQWLGRGGVACRDAVLGVGLSVGLR